VNTLSHFLLMLGQSGVELSANGDRLRHRPSMLAPDVLARLRMHKAAILGLLMDGYIADGVSDPEAAYLLFERLGIADDLGMPTHVGAPAWLIAVGESMQGARWRGSDYDQSATSNALIDLQNSPRGYGGVAR